jgi:hypothetical protein
MANKHIRNTHFIPVINNDWKTKAITIKNKTIKVLSNGAIIPSESKMMRLAYKSGK